jgi:hypothetical protein
MTKTEAKRHARHLCDVFPIDEEDEHIGVITYVRGDLVMVSGHPEYGPRMFTPEELTTSCTIED